ncbi:MAG TPA: PhzF family phenazine biosynthesis protein [Acidimicrobiia bacterium]|nr:PhzF family phenazine biosynthesis protein [Acidimicrobiia bacterium]
MPRHCYVLRVFTRDGAGGNPLGVVTDTLGLDDQKMQRLAADLGFSETIFLSWFEGPMPSARIFTPRTELSFAGHPLVGAAWLLLNLGPLDPGAIECGIGPVRIRQAGGLTWVDAPSHQPVAPGRLRVDPQIEPLELIEVSMPLPYVLVQLDSPADVAAASPESFPADEVYVWAWESEGRSVRARFFARGVGIEEDPATGSAAVAMAARMRQRGVDQGTLVINQGQETGYPSRIHLVWDSQRSSIGGTVTRDEVRFLEI